MVLVTLKNETNKPVECAWGICTYVVPAGGELELPDGEVVRALLERFPFLKAEKNEIKSDKIKEAAQARKIAIEKKKIADAAVQAANEAEDEAKRVEKEAKLQADELAKLGVKSDLPKEKKVDKKENKK